MAIHENAVAKLWREQFTNRDDYLLAGKILEKFKFVSASEFRSDMHAYILRVIPKEAKAAFFIERELQLVHRKWQYKQSIGHVVKHKFTGKVAVPMYKEISFPRGRGLPKRWTASGSPLPPVKSPRNATQVIGSEGVVASLISKLCESTPSRFAMHPHTNALAQIKVQFLVVVTDFIGSGNRTRQMLDSLWRVASVRSWKSGGYVKLLVICYSATEGGLEHVKQHPCQPEVHYVCKCPTISNSFSEDDGRAIEELCRRIPVGATRPLGYEDTGALIAFEHSCPNNVPAMFVESVTDRTPGWSALFPKRISHSIGKAELISSSRDGYAVALDALKCGRIFEHAAFRSSSADRQSMVVLLAAVYRGRRHTHELVGACGFPMVEVLESWELAVGQGLLNNAGRLTESGRTLLKNLMTPAVTATSVAISPDINYYPSSLRVPVGNS